MLTREIMGALALAILWVNTLLIAAVALGQAGRLRSRLSALRPLAPGREGAGLLRARIDVGRGEGGALARWSVEQIGRAGVDEGEKRTIHFGDRTFEGAVLGGEVIAGDARVRVPASKGEVWPERADVLAAAACPGQARFEEAYEEARKARGHAREVTVGVAAGAHVWLGGVLRKVEGRLQVEAPEGGLVLVSAIDPRAWLRGKIALAVGFAIAVVLVAAGVTALALTPPRFDGWMSLTGGVLGLGFFLGVQPLGTAVRDAVRAPGQAFVRGRWIEPSPRANASSRSGDAGGRRAASPARDAQRAEQPEGETA